MSDARIAALEARVSAQDECLRILLDMLQRDASPRTTAADEVRKARAELQAGVNEAALLFGAPAPVRNKIIPSR